MHGNKGNLDERPPCSGAMLDQRWLCDGGVTIEDGFRRFQPDAEGIAMCNKCCFGEDARSHSSREHARSEELW